MNDDVPAVIHSGNFIIDLCPYCKEHRTCEKVTIHTNTIVDAMQCEVCKTIIATDSLDKLFDRAKKLYKEAMDNEKG